MVDDSSEQQTNASRAVSASDCPAFASQSSGESQTSSSCWMDFVTLPDEWNLAELVSQGYDPTKPVWTGEQVEQLAPADPTQRQCPPSWRNPGVRVHLSLYNESVVFHWTGFATLVGYAGMRNGWPVGVYGVSLGTAYATGPFTGNKYKAVGGEIHAECHYARVQVGSSHVGDLWRMVSFNFTGPVYLESVGGTPGDGGGWSHARSNGIDVYVQYGAGNGWQSVLNKYLGGGGCTRGWTVYVDGVQKCNGTQHNA